MHDHVGSYHRAILDFCTSRPEPVARFFSESRREAVAAEQAKRAAECLAAVRPES
jgi:hypothetical protein